MTLTDRAGKILGSAPIPAGTASELVWSDAAKTVLQSMICTFKFDVMLYERSADMTFVTMRWPDTGVKWEETLQYAVNDRIPILKVIEF